MPKVPFTPPGRTSCHRAESHVARVGQAQPVRVLRRVGVRVLLWVLDADDLRVAALDGRRMRKTVIIFGGLRGRVCFGYTCDFRRPLQKICHE